MQYLSSILKEDHKTVQSVIIKFVKQYRDVVMTTQKPGSSFNTVNRNVCTELCLDCVTTTTGSSFLSTMSLSTNTDAVACVT